MLLLDSRHITIGLCASEGFTAISALAKSHCDNALDGMIKILAKDNKIIGAHIISNEASSLIQQIVIAMQTNTTIEQLKAVCFGHPTYSEGIFDCLMRLK